MPVSSRPGSHPVVDPEHVRPEPGIDGGRVGGRGATPAGAPVVVSIVGLKGHRCLEPPKGAIPATALYGEAVTRFNGIRRETDRSSRRAGTAGCINIGTSATVHVAKRTHRYSFRNSGPGRARSASAVPTCPHSQRQQRAAQHRRRQRPRQQHPSGLHHERTTAQDAALPATAASTPGDQADQAELHQPGGADLRPRGAERLQHHRIPHPLPLPGRHRAGQHQRAGQQGHGCRSPPARCRPGRAAPPPPPAHPAPGCRRRWGGRRSPPAARRRPAPASPRTVAMWVCGAASSRPGRGDQGEVHPQPPPVHVAQVGDRSGRWSRPSTLTRDRVADADPPAARRCRHRRRPAARRGSPAAHQSPGHQPRALRRRGGIGQAAVAAQRPGGLRRGLHLLGRDALHRDDAGAQAAAPA